MKFQTMCSQKPPFNPLEIFCQFDWNENDDFEFKSTKGSLPQSPSETYSAMPNTKEGVIFFKVENNGTVSGLIDTKESKKTSGIRLTTELKLVSIFLIIMIFKTLLAIRVPRASR